ncbi:cation transporter, partial [Escherichia coli]
HQHNSACCSSSSCSSTAVQNSKNVSNDSHTHEHDTVEKHPDDDEEAHQHQSCCSTSHQAHDHQEHEHSHQHTACCSSSSELQNDAAPAQAAGQRFNWIIRGMDCPSCAQKIENAVKQITEVKQAKVLFATEKLVVDADKDISSAVRATVDAAGYELLDV